MQSVSSKIWTRVAVSISYDDNHYTTDSSHFYIMVQTFGTEWNFSLKPSSLIIIATHTGVLLW